MPRVRRTDQQAREELVRLSSLHGWKFTPTQPFPGVSKPWKGLCGTCGREANPRLDNLLIGRGCCNGCKYDSQDICKRQPNAEAASEDKGYGFVPAEDYHGSTRLWRGSCANCGRERRVYMGHLRRGISACPACNIGVGDDQAWDDANIFYVVRNPDTGAIKFGITRKDVRPRLSRHKMVGYSELLKVLTLPAPEPVVLERRILLKLKSLGAKPVHGREFFAEEWLAAVEEELCFQKTDL